MGWQTTDDVAGKPALWRQPGDGLGAGCTTWSPMASCITRAGSEFMFALNKS
jgi:hypothetical protein